MPQRRATHGHPLLHRHHRTGFELVKRARTIDWRGKDHLPLVLYGHDDLFINDGGIPLKYTLSFVKNRVRLCQCVKSYCRILSIKGWWMGRSTAVLWRRCDVGLRRAITDNPIYCLLNSHKSTFTIICVGYFA